MGSFVIRSTHKIFERKMRRVGHVVHRGEWTGEYRILVVKPEVKGPPESPRRRMADITKSDLQ
jgi:hypothetical protein